MVYGFAVEAATIDVEFVSELIRDKEQYGVFAPS